MTIKIKTDCGTVSEVLSIDNGKNRLFIDGREYSLACPFRLYLYDDIYIGCSDVSGNLEIVKTGENRFLISPKKMKTVFSETRWIRRR